MGSVIQCLYQLQQLKVNNKMKFINSWSSKIKQFDKINILIRISILTIFQLYFDISNKKYEIKIFNFGIKN